MRLRHPEEAIRAFRWAVGLELLPHWQRFFLGEALLGARERSCCSTPLKVSYHWNAGPLQISTLATSHPFGNI